MRKRKKKKEQQSTNRPTYVQEHQLTVPLGAAATDVDKYMEILLEGCEVAPETYSQIRNFIVDQSRAKGGKGWLTVDKPTQEDLDNGIMRITIT